MQPAKTEFLVLPMIKAPFRHYLRRSEHYELKWILLFLALLLALALPIGLVRGGILHLTVEEQILDFCYACSPGLAALIVWFRLGGNTLSFTWKAGSVRYLLFGLLCPAVVGF
ncbi:MAG: hypothetical protein JOY96_09980 [Verrucomicrobia bacterium]|nr:hypothetical protein [Verrucomicrobiota bacterium]